MPVRDAVEDLELLHVFLEQQQALNVNMTALVATLRSHVNNLVYAGMCQAEGGSGQWKRDFAVPFAAVAFADIGENGLVISTGSGGETQGPGTLVVPEGGYGCVPLTGRSVNVAVGSIRGAGIGTGFYLAVFTTPQPFAFGVI